jgi:hypothetical protein
MYNFVVKDIQNNDSQSLISPINITSNSKQILPVMRKSVESVQKVDENNDYMVADNNPHVTKNLKNNLKNIMGRYVTNNKVYRSSTVFNNLKDDSEVLKSNNGSSDIQNGVSVQDENKDELQDVTGKLWLICIFNNTKYAGYFCRKRCPCIFSIKFIYL